METKCVSQGCPSKREMADSKGVTEKSSIKELFTNV